MEPQIKKLPRFINSFKSSYNIDIVKVKVLEEVMDEAELDNIIQGKQVTSKIYPLIYENSSIPEAYYRSLEFYRLVSAKPEHVSTIPDNYILNYLVGLRDLYYSSCFGLLSEDESEMIKNVIKATNSDLVELYTVKKTYKIHPNNQDFLNVAGLEVSPFPNSSHNQLRLFDNSLLSRSNKEHFLTNELGLVIGFLNNYELSYHNFENVINLNELIIENKTNFSVTSFTKENEKEIFHVRLKELGKKPLKFLDSLDLYTLLINASSRGGKRFVFSSTELADSLYYAMFTGKTGENVRKFMSLSKIVNINHIYRFNKFTPNDKKFITHYDTPYCDKANKRYSKYTMIMYLTSGKANPILKFNNPDEEKSTYELEEIKVEDNEIYAIIFDQKYEHEGKPFLDTDKLFIRTELIFEYEIKNGETNITEQQMLASKLFNVGCYMTKQSLFNNELNSYSNDCFNSASKMRLKLQKQLNFKFTYLHKCHDGIDYITDGNDYWFCNSVSLRDAAIATILDYFNGALVDKKVKYFNQATHSKILPGDVDVNRDISEQMYNYLQAISEVEEKMKESSSIGAPNFLKYDLNHDFYQRFNVPYELTQCCDKHEYDDGEKKQHLYFNEARDEYNEVNSKSKSYLSENYAIMIFDNIIKIDQAKIAITENEIYFNYKIPKINFACYDVTDECITNLEEHLSYENVDTLGFMNLPPIQYITSSKGHHLKLVLFNNDVIRSGIKTTFKRVRFVDQEKNQVYRKFELKGDDTEEIKTSNNENILGFI